VSEPVLILVGPWGASGGIADVMRAIDAWMRAEGRATVVINTSCDGSLPKRLAVGVLGVLRAAWVVFATPGALVHVHSASYGSFLRKSLVVLAARLRGRPVLLHIHGGGFSSFAECGPPLRKTWVSAVLKQADAICVVSSRTMQTVHRLQPGARTSIVPNPVTLLCGDRTDPRQRRVLFLGRLGATKGTDVLLQAIRILQTADISAEFVLAGDGEVDKTRAIVQTLPDPAAVHVPGWLDAEAVHGLLHRSSVFCLPSRFEGMPMALLQAMSHGLACVVTPVGGMADIVDDGVNGLVVPEDDPEAVAIALGVLLADAGIRSRLGERAADAVGQSYSLETVMRRLEGIYSELSGERASHARP
jgi:glycosyltransferase involved in cell wall biosynthesis